MEREGKRLAEHRERRTELALIEAIRARAARLPVTRDLIVGIGDDCAVLRPRRGEDLAMTTDLLLENVHFRRAWHPPESVGHRALARGLSDLAAAGAKPIAAYLSIALPADLVGTWMNRFLDGWMRLAGEHGVPLAGGDTAEVPRIRRRPGLVMVDVALVGAVPRGRALLRSGARAGDILYITGSLGGSVVELRDLRKGNSRKRKPGEPHPHLYPQPRLAIGRRLMRRRIATAAIDTSDGLATDLLHMCQASHLGAVVDREAIPRAPGASFHDALTGGEDYELLFTAPRRQPVRSVNGVRVYAIGEMTANAGLIELRSPDGSREPLTARGWEYFRHK